MSREEAEQRRGLELQMPQMGADKDSENHLRKSAKSAVKKLSDGKGLSLFFDGLRSAMTLALFSAELLDLEMKLWDYVIVHEPLHFSVPNHGKLWKSLMRAHLGDFEAMERELR